MVRPKAELALMQISNLENRPACLLRTGQRQPDDPANCAHYRGEAPKYQYFACS